MKFLAAQRHWIAGIAVALFGVLLARGISPAIDGNGLRFAILLLGHITCLLGLFLIARGVFLRHRSEDSDE